MAKYSEKQNKWTQEYIRNNYEEIKVRVPKGKKEEYKALAEKSGKSLNRFITDYMEMIRMEEQKMIEADRRRDEENMDINSFVNGIIEEQQKLSELKAYEEHKANGDITEAVLICNPKVTYILKSAIYENNLKDIPIISTPLAEEDKIYMVTNKEFIENARMMMEIK